jgi:hypothetical protein
MKHPKANPLVSLPELSEDELARVHGGDRGFFASGALDDERDALADSDAHGAERVAPAGAAELVHRGRDEARAAGAERVAEGDGAAIGIHVGAVVR